MKKIICLCSFLVILFGLAGCKGEVSSTKIVIEFSSFSGEKQKEIQLNDDETELNLSGTISMADGSVELYVLGKDTDDVLYSETYTKEDNGMIKIDISDLKGNVNCVLGLKADKAKSFKLNLVSEQKLVKDKERPEKPEI